MPAFFIFFIIIFIIILGIIIYQTIFKYFFLIPYKQDVVKKELANLNVSYNYKEKNPILTPLIENLGLINNARHYIETDIIRENNYISFDLEAYHMSGGKNNHKVIDFLGRVYKIEIEDAFSCSFILKEEILNRAPNGFTLVDTELSSFNKKYNLYTDDENKIFSIYTPKVIKELSELILNTDYIFIFGYKNVLIFGLNDRLNYFEQYKNIKAIKEEYLKQKKKIDAITNIFK